MYFDELVRVRNLYKSLSWNNNYSYRFNVS